MDFIIFILIIFLIYITVKVFTIIRLWKLKATSYDLNNPKIKKLEKDRRELLNEKEHFEVYKVKTKSILDNEKRKNELDLKEMKIALEKLSEQKTRGFPWLANAYAEYFHLLELKEAENLRRKKRPAIKTAEKLAKISKEKRIAEKKQRTYKYIIEFYESLFPWLPDLREIEDDDIIRIDKTDEKSEDSSDRTKNWLLPEEYKQLSTPKKNQLALDRYRQRKKSNWEIGRDYERYVGYYFENKKWKVDYQGILKGFEDMGRDLIVHKNNHTSIVQCKYWSKRKTIHEKHVFQLFGTTIEYFLKNYKLNKSTQLNFFVDLLKGENINGIFITNIELSEMARKVANALNIEVWENFGLEEYPIIKCNVAQHTGEKIYHLPLDQQYDKVKIIEANGDRYVSTVKEAEELGFRRAFRWTGNKTTN